MNKRAARTARNQAEPLIEEHDFELRVLKEFNKKLDALIDQTVATDPDAKHCYNMLKEQVRSLVNFVVKSISTLLSHSV